MPVATQEAEVARSPKPKHQLLHLLFNLSEQWNRDTATLFMFGKSGDGFIRRSHMDETMIQVMYQVWVLRLELKILHASKYAKPWELWYRSFLILVSTVC